MAALAETLDILSALRARYASMTGGVAMGDPKDVISALVRVLEDGLVRYAMIGGMAAQVWRSEPRTTLDIDLAVRSYDDLPVAELERAGFLKLARHEHTENWRAPDGSPIQFSDDPLFAEAIATAVTMRFADATVRVISARELVRAKLRACIDPARRRSKRLQDLADAASVVEAHPEVRDSLSEEERRALDGLPSA